MEYDPGKGWVEEGWKLPFNGWLIIYAVCFIGILLGFNEPPEAEQPYRHPF